MIDPPLHTTDLRKKITTYLDNETYKFTEHAIEEMGEDHFDFRDILHILKYGAHAKDYDGLKANHWRYAIEGRALNGKFGRVIIRFSGDLLIIITTFKIIK